MEAKKEIEHKYKGMIKKKGGGLKASVRKVNKNREIQNKWGDGWKASHYPQRIQDMPWMDYALVHSKKNPAPNFVDMIAKLQMNFEKKRKKERKETNG